MSRKCQISGKTGSTGNTRSHACNANKRTFGANIIKKKIVDPKTGRVKKMKVAASTLRTLDKKLS